MLYIWQCRYTILLSSCAPVYTTHNNVIVNCSVPGEPVNGTILDYDNIVTTEGSVITFQCNSGLSPEENMTATCTNAGVWSTDPAGVKCMNITGKLIFGVLHMYRVLILLNERNL